MRSCRNRKSQSLTISVSCSGSSSLAQIFKMASSASNSLLFNLDKSTCFRKSIKIIAGLELSGYVKSDVSIIIILVSYEHIYHNLIGIRIEFLDFRIFQFRMYPPSSVSALAILATTMSLIFSANLRTLSAVWGCKVMFPKTSKNASACSVTSFSESRLDVLELISGFELSGLLGC